MATIVGPSITVDCPFLRLSIPGDIRDFYDSTNRRYKSGYAASAISALSLAGTFGAGDILSIVVKPANFNPLCGHTQARYNPTATGAVAGFAAYSLNTSNNYGLPGPSARLEGDSTISYIDLEFTLTPLTPASTSSLAPTVTYTNTTTLIDPYSSLAGTAISGVLGVNPDNEAHWSSITYPITTSSAAAIQLQTLTSTVQAGIPAGSEPPMLQLMSAAQPGGQQICSQSIPLGVSGSRVKTFYDNFTWVWAVNSQKVDENGTPIIRPGSGIPSEWQLLNCGLTKGALSGDTASLTLASQIRIY